MTDIKHSYPSLEDAKEISKKFDFKRFKIVNGNIKDIKEPNDDVTKLRIVFSNKTLKLNLWNRLMDVQKSFIFMIFYYEKGIPDDVWWESPGKSGYSVSYYPKFSNQNFSDKMNFDYYTDFFYYKLFSSWDTIGHILNLFHQLEINERDVYLNRCVNKLKYKCENLYKELKKIIKNEDYTKANRIRHDITHNFPPNRIGPGIKETETEKEKIIRITVGEYTTSNEIVDNVYKSLELMSKTLELIFELKK